MVDEKTLRAEFERQHSGRNLKRHRMRGTYFSATIAALWNQHLRTAKWLASYEGFKQITDLRAAQGGATGAN